MVAAHTNTTDPDREWLDEHVDPEKGKFWILNMLTGQAVCSYSTVTGARNARNTKPDKRGDDVIAVWRGIDKLWCVVPNDWPNPSEDKLREEQLVTLLVEEALIAASLPDHVAQVVTPVVRAAERKDIREMISKMLSARVQIAERLALNEVLHRLDERNSSAGT